MLVQRPAPLLGEVPLVLVELLGHPLHPLLVAALLLLLPQENSWVGAGGTHGCLHPPKTNPVGLTGGQRLGAAGRMGRTKRRWDPTAAGKGGEEKRAATKLMREIQENISSGVLNGDG